MVRSLIRHTLNYLLTPPGHLSLEDRVRVVEDSMDSLDSNVKDQKSRLDEWLGCGIHSADYARRHQ